MFLSVIIPAYNEEKTIADAVSRTQEYLARQPYDWEIIVVDDGSTDRTREIVSALIWSASHIRLIHYVRNRGKGYAVRQGFLQAGGTYRLFTDADGATPIETLGDFLPQAPSYDLLIGSRAAPGAVIARPQPCWRTWVGRIFHAVARWLLCIRGIGDTQCGFKLLSASAVNRIIPLCRSSGWAFDAELLALAQTNGITVKEIPVTWRNGSGSKVRLSGAPRVLAELAAIRANLWRQSLKNIGR